MKKEKARDQWNQTKEQYEYLVKANSIALGWEFLRRGENYRRLFDKYSQTEYAAKAAQRFFLMREFIPPGQGHLSTEDLLKLREWPSAIMEDGNFRPLVISGGMEYPRPKPAGHLTIRFDLDADVDFQLLVAQTALIKMWELRPKKEAWLNLDRSEIRKKADVERLRNIHYLRVFDAGKLNIKHEELAEHLNESYVGAFHLEENESAPSAGIGSAGGRREIKKRKPGGGRVPGARFSKAIFGKHLKIAKDLSAYGYPKLLRPSEDLEKVWLTFWKARLAYQNRALEADFGL